MAGVRRRGPGRAQQRHRDDVGRSPWASRASVCPATKQAHRRQGPHPVSRWLYFRNLGLLDLSSQTSEQSVPTQSAGDEAEVPPLLGGPLTWVRAVRAGVWHVLGQGEALDGLAVVQQPVTDLPVSSCKDSCARSQCPGGRWGLAGRTRLPTAARSVPQRLPTAAQPSTGPRGTKAPITGAWAPLGCQAELRPSTLLSCQLLKAGPSRWTGRGWCPRTTPRFRGR